MIKFIHPPSILLFVFRFLSYHASAQQAEVDKIMVGAQFAVTVYNWNNYLKALRLGYFWNIKIWQEGSGKTNIF